MTNPNSEEFLEHYGVGPDDNPPGRGSGRYPKGSGKNPFQHDSYYQQIQELKREGLSDKEIAAEFNMNTSEYRAMKTIVVAEHKKEQALRAKEYADMLDENGERLYSNVAIGKMLGVPESTVRNYLKEDYVGNSTKIQQTVDALKSMCNDKNYIDVGPGSNLVLQCSTTRLSQAVKILEETEGYCVEPIYVKQLGTGLQTTVKTLAPPGTTRSDIYEHLDYINPPQGTVKLYPSTSDEVGMTSFVPKPPTSLSSKRIQIKYAEDGGKEKDGVIEIRRGLDDLNLGNASYAQVRIMVDKTHYLKGMAVYSDNLPDGVDVRFNTNKTKDVPMMGKKDNTVLKPIKDEDPKNPFGATIRSQIEYKDKNGKIILSPINIVNEEGSWGGEDGWSKSVASQMLAKQGVPLIKRQLKLSYSDKVSDYDDIMMVSNPVVRKKLLEAFADNCDTAAVHLKASPFPRQTWNVILPVESLSPNEIYAPHYNNGETVVLIRYPHGGTFEIPQLVVNNKNKEAKSTLGTAIDAVGINARVAEKLSGADFDGDTVLVIPANSSSSNVKIKVDPSLEGLDGFDPKTEYAYREGMKIMGKQQTQREMGIISNLITDMTLKGAKQDEIAAAVRHSMVVIDAHKHKLDYQRSYKENGIEALKARYQKKEDPDNGKGYGGASTLLSRAKSEQRVNERKEGIYITDPVTGKTKKRYINPETGEKEYTYTNRTKLKLVTDDNGDPILDSRGKKQYVDTGELVTQKSTQMYEAKDARDLTTGHLVVEDLYANYANQLKGLANEARKAYLATPPIEYHPDQKIKYQKEVDSLNSKLIIAQKNAPRERQAQIVANLKYKKMLDDSEYLTDEEKKKYKFRALAEARDSVGAKKSQFNGKSNGLSITEEEWKAIQSGAISNHKLEQIVANSDIDYLKRLSMPRIDSRPLSSAKVAKIKNMANSGFSIAEIAKIMGLSDSTVSKYVKGEDK